MIEPASVRARKPKLSCAAPVTLALRCVAYCSSAVCSIGILPLQASHTWSPAHTRGPGWDACWLYDLSLSAPRGTAEACVGCMLLLGLFMQLVRGWHAHRATSQRKVQLRYTLQRPAVAAPARHHASALCCAAAAVHTLNCLAQQSA